MDARTILLVVLAAVAVAFGILPPAYAPIASLLGGVMAVMHARALDRLRGRFQPVASENV